MEKPVCKNVDDDAKDPFSFFFYGTVFIKLGLKLPVTVFEKEILIMLEYFQLHLTVGSLDYFWDFKILCTHFSIILTSNMFVFFFEFKISSHQLWATLNIVLKISRTKY